MVYVDLTAGNRLEAFRGAVTSGSLDIETFGLTDGRHTLTIIAYNSSGNRVTESTVPFDVANSQVDLSAQSVLLRNWTKEDLLDPDVERYRVFAEATAKVTGGSSGGAMGGAMPGMGSAWRGNARHDGRWWRDAGNGRRRNRCERRQSGGAR